MRSFRISMGSIPLMVTVGVVAGSMVLAFYVGFASGRSVGFDEAFASTSASAPKLPISGEETASISEEELASRILAQLNERSDMGGAAKAAPAAQAIDASQLVGAASDDDNAGVADIRDEVDAPAAAGVKLNTSDPFAISAEPIKKRPSAAASEAVGELAVGEKARLASNTTKVIPASSSASSAAAIVKSAKAAKIDLKAEKKLAEEKKLADSKVTKTKQVLTKGWFAQVAAPQNKADADSLSSRLSSSGFRVSIDRADIKGQSFFRVLVGPEESKTQGERLVQQLKRERYIKGDPFLKNVK